MEYAEYDASVRRAYPQDREWVPEMRRGQATTLAPADHNQASTASEATANQNNASDSPSDSDSDQGILGALTSILVGGVTELLTDLSPHAPTPSSASARNPSSGTSRSNLNQLLPHSPEASCSRGIGCPGNTHRSVDVASASSHAFSAGGAEFAAYSADARLRGGVGQRSAATTGGDVGWVDGAADPTHIMPARPQPQSQSQCQSYGGDVAPANSLVGSPTAGSAGLLGAMFSGITTLGQRATDLLTQLDHDFETIFSGGGEDGYGGNGGGGRTEAATKAAREDASDGRQQQRRSFTGDIRRSGGTGDTMQPQGLHHHGAHAAAMSNSARMVHHQQQAGAGGRPSAHGATRSSLGSGIRFTGAAAAAAAGVAAAHGGAAGSAASLAAARRLSNSYAAMHAAAAPSSASGLTTPLSSSFSRTAGVGYKGAAGGIGSAAGKGQPQSRWGAASGGAKARSSFNGSLQGRGDHLDDDDDWGWGTCDDDHNHGGSAGAGGSSSHRSSGGRDARNHVTATSTATAGAPPQRGFVSRLPHYTPPPAQAASGASSAAMRAAAGAGASLNNIALSSFPMGSGGPKPRSSGGKLIIIKPSPAAVAARKAAAGGTGAAVTPSAGAGAAVLSTAAQGAPAVGANAVTPAERVAAAAAAAEEAAESPTLALPTLLFHTTPARPEAEGASGGRSGRAASSEGQLASNRSVASHISSSGIPRTPVGGCVTPVAPRQQQRWQQRQQPVPLRLHKPEQDAAVPAPQPAPQQKEQLQQLLQKRDEQLQQWQQRREQQQRKREEKLQEQRQKREELLQQQLEQERQQREQQLQREQEQQLQEQQKQQQEREEQQEQPRWMQDLQVLRNHMEAKSSPRPEGASTFTFPEAQAASASSPAATASASSSPGATPGTTGTPATATGTEAEMLRAQLAEARGAAASLQAELAAAQAGREELRRQLAAAAAEAVRLGGVAEALEGELGAAGRRCGELEKENARLRQQLLLAAQPGVAPFASPARSQQHQHLNSSAAATPVCAGKTPPRASPHPPSSAAAAHRSPSPSPGLAFTTPVTAGGRHSRRGSFGSGIGGHSRRGSFSSTVGVPVGGMEAPCFHIGRSDDDNDGINRGGIGDELVEAALVAQLTAALADKARLSRENDELTRQLEGLQELLAYTAQNSTYPPGFGEGFEEGCEGLEYAYEYAYGYGDDPEGSEEYEACYWRTGTTPPRGVARVEEGEHEPLGEGEQYGEGEGYEETELAPVGLLSYDDGGCLAGNGNGEDAAAAAALNGEEGGGGSEEAGVVAESAAAPLDEIPLPSYSLVDSPAVIAAAKELEGAVVQGGSTGEAVNTSITFEVPSPAAASVLSQPPGLSRELSLVFSSTAAALTSPLLSPAGSGTVASLEGLDGAVAVGSPAWGLGIAATEGGSLDALPIATYDTAFSTAQLPDWQLDLSPLLSLQPGDLEQQHQPHRLNSYLDGWEILDGSGEAEKPAYNGATVAATNASNSHGTTADAAADMTGATCAQRTSTAAMSAVAALGAATGKAGTVVTGAVAAAAAAAAAVGLSANGAGSGGGASVFFPRLSPRAMKERTNIPGPAHSAT